MPLSGVSQGYLLTGMAKPIATAHYIFELFFSDCEVLSLSEKDKDRDDKSDMG